MPSSKPWGKASCFVGPHVCYVLLFESITNDRPTVGHAGISTYRRSCIHCAFSADNPAVVTRKGPDAGHDHPLEIVSRLIS